MAGPPVETRIAVMQRDIDEIKGGISRLEINTKERFADLGDERKEDMAQLRKERADDNEAMNKRLDTLATSIGRVKGYTLGILALIGVTALGTLVVAVTSWLLKGGVAGGVQ